MIKRLFAAAAIAVGLTSSPVSPANAQTELTFTLDFISLGRHAPWYVALEKGYFKEEGLDVEIIPAKGTADAIRAVATGIAQIGLIDVPSLVAAGSASGGMKIVHGAYVEAPYCIFSLADGANVTKPEEMEGLNLGSSSASFVPQIWKAFMNMNGVDADTLNIVNIEPASRVPMLATEQVDSIDLFIMSMPGIKRAAQGKEPVCMFAADFGLGLYSNSIGVSEAYLNENPDVVRGFVRAAMRGWQYTMANRDEAAELTVKQVPALNLEIVREEIDILERIGINDSVRENGFGHIDPERFAATVAFINDNVEVTGDPVTADALFVPGFAPEEPILP